jgi:Late competence development protein ComFB
MNYPAQAPLLKNYINVMELLVEDEVRRQTKNMSPRTASLIRSPEVISYALNQLPSLYATSKRGWDYQVREGQRKYGVQISQTVRYAVNAVLRDPIASSASLEVQLPSTLRDVLYQLRHMLHNPDLDWENIPYAIGRLLTDHHYHRQLSNYSAVQNNLEVSQQQLGYRFSNGKSKHASELSSQVVMNGLGPNRRDVGRLSNPIHLASSVPLEERQGWNDPLVL